MMQARKCSKTPIAGCRRNHREPGKKRGMEPLDEDFEIVLSEISARQHRLVQDSHDQHAVRLGQIEDDMTSNFKSAQTGLNRIAGSADGGIAAQQFEPIFEPAKMPIGLTPSPSLDCVGNDLIDIAFGLGRDSMRQGLSLSGRQPVLSTYP